MRTDERRLDWPNTFNTRDLGGYPMANGQRVGWRQFIRSDNLVRLTPAGQDALVDYGVRTIIDLRFPIELKANPSPFTNAHRQDNLPVYRHLSLIDESLENVSSPRVAQMTMFERYCDMLEHFQLQIKNIFRTIAGADEGAILFYCNAGKDRTGIVAALLLSLCDVSAADVSNNYAESTAHLQPLVDRWRAEIGDDPKQQSQLSKDMASEPQTMLEMLAFVEQTYGGVDSYLRTVGVSAGEIDAVRARAQA